VEKFIKEEDLSYNMVFPCWIWWFIHGLFLNPITFVLPNYEGNMGWISIDCTNTSMPPMMALPIPKSQNQELQVDLMKIWLLHMVQPSGIFLPGYTMYV